MMTGTDRVLFPPMDKKVRAGPSLNFFEWEQIQVAAPQVPLMPEDHPFVPYLPLDWDQGGEYDCVGMATAIMQQANYLAVTRDFPTKEEMDQVKRNVTTTAHGCMILFDVWYHTVFSAWWSYIVSRIDGDVSGDIGSYCAISIKTAQKTGGVPWHCCLTPKSRACPGKDVSFPLEMEELRGLAGGHKIDGYATISTWDGLKSAIITGRAHCVIMPINMYSAPPDKAGNLVMSGSVIGAHALPWLFVDLFHDRVGCWNSWGPDYPRITWIDREYWSKCAGKAFSPLDSAEVAIAREVYTVLDVTANVDCIMAVDEVERPERMTFSAAVLRGQSHTVTARPVESGEYEPAARIFTICPSWETRIPVPFTFTKKIGTPQPGGGMPAWAQKLFEWLKNIFRKVMIRPSVRTTGEPIAIGVMENG